LKKYRGPKNTGAGNYAGHGRADFNNERWMRYAEVLLLHAEALIESNQDAAGMDIINNQIRARVGLGDSPIADAKLALRHERRVEMAFEPHRWFDITRWGIGAEVFGAKWDDKFNVLPFPQSAIDRSGGVVQQNPGY
jgi:starch-binding outer membrane protein, SusD/RagB family